MASPKATATLTASLTPPGHIGETVTDSPANIHHHLALAANATMNLEKTVGGLEEVLDDVLRASDPIEGMATPSQAFSSHASKLENLTSHVIDIDHRLQRLINRIDL